MDAVKLSEFMYDFEGARYSNYDEELVGYFLMTKIEDNRLWMEDSMDDRMILGLLSCPKKLRSYVKREWNFPVLLHGKGMNGSYWRHGMYIRNPVAP